MHMLAKGTVNGTTVTNLKFEHLTALYQFKFTNRRPDAYKVTKVVVSADAAIFPKTLTVSGEEKTYGDKSNSLTLSMTSLEMAKNEVAYGYLSFFPMADMTKDTELTFTATIEKVGDSSSTETIEKKGKISELYNAESVVAGDEYKYVAGKRYGISFMLVADLGYEETEAGKYLVKKEDGLINLASEPTVMTNAATVITLDADLDMSTKEAWVPVTEFKGILDGNGKTISGLTIEATGNDAGLFITNNGIIKNLTLKDVTVKQVSGAAGAFAAINTGTIQNCVIDGGALTVNGVQKNNIEDNLLTSEQLPSGVASTFISQDGERTFGTYLGAAASLKAEDLTLEMFKGYAYLFIEGYLVQDHEMILHAIELAKEAGLQICLDMASYNIVENDLEFFSLLINKYVDIVFANEEEAKAFTGEEPEEALRVIAKKCSIAIVKVGANGSYIRKGTEEIKVSAIPVEKVLDTTGAGDYFAAGFLYGLTCGYSLEKCAKIGSILSGNVIQVIGTTISPERWDEIKLNINKVLAE